MAKTVKFNLICDGKPVRTLEELQESFSLEDMLNHYKSGMLQRWLTTRGYEKHLAAVQAISSEEDLTIAQDLCDIFGAEQTEKELLTILEDMQYKVNLLKRREEIENLSQKQQGTIAEHNKEYYALIQKIIANKHDVAEMKEAVETIANEYGDLFELHYWQLFETLYQLAPMAIFVMLSNEHMRKKYLQPEQPIKVRNYERADFERYLYNNDKNIDLFNMDEVNLFLSMMCYHTHYYINRLSDKSYNFSPKCVKKLTSSDPNTWLPVQAAPGKQLLIIKAVGNDIKLKIGSKAFSRDEIHNKYMLVDAFEYNDSTAYGNNAVWYMEV